MREISTRLGFGQPASGWARLRCADGSYRWVSPAVTRSMGWTPDELVGTILGELVHPDDLLATAATRTAIYAGQKTAMAEGRLVLRLRTKDGTWRWAGRDEPRR